MRGLKSFHIHVGVDLGCGNVAVAKHHLYGAQVCSTGKKMCCKGVTQAVWADLGYYSCGKGSLMNDLPEANARHRFAAVGDKKKSARLPF